MAYQCYCEGEVIGVICILYQYEASEVEQAEERSAEIFLERTRGRVAAPHTRRPSLHDSSNVNNIFLSKVFQKFT